MDLELINKVNKIFDRKIKSNKKVKIDFKIHKELFNITLNFTSSDWRIIRTEKYWKTIGSLPLESRKKTHISLC